MRANIDYLAYCSSSADDRMLIFSHSKDVYLMLKATPLVKWTVVTGVLLLLLMTICRIVFFYVFPDNSGESHLDSFMLGFRYDLRMACIVVMPLFVVGSMHINYREGKMTLASKIRLVVSLLFIIGAILFLRNNKASTTVLAPIMCIYLVLLFLLFRKKDLNPFAGKPQQRSWMIYLIVASTVLIILYAVDFQHYDYLQQRLNASILGYTADAEISMGMVWQTYPVVWILVGISIVIAVVVWLIRKLFRWAALRKENGASKQAVSISIVLFLLLATGIFGRISQYPLRWSDAYNLKSEYKANLALNPLQTFFSSLRFKDSGYDLAKVKRYYPLVAQLLGVQNPDSTLLNFTRTYPTDSTIKAAPNVVLVICESFSGYKSSMWGNPLNTTPYFHELTKRGIFFDKCFTPAYGTARGLWAIMTGVPDVEPAPNTASRNPRAVSQRIILNDFRGYEKYYFIGGSTSWANVRGLLNHNIKDLKLFEEDDFRSSAVDVWGISDKQLFLEANDVIKNEKKPFFAIIQTAGNHRPYTIPAEDTDFEKVDLPIDTLRKYGFGGNDELNAFRYTDYCFRKFMDAASQQNYFNNTLFVFIGDHGIRGDAGELLPRSYTELGLTTQHVPLLFYAPMKLSPQRRSDVVSQVDVLPSIAGATGIPFSNHTLGRNLFDRRQQQDSAGFAFLFDPDRRQVGIVSGSFCYMRQQDDGKETVMSMTDDLPISDPKIKEHLARLRTLTDAWYETARYMLLNNKNPKKI
jgi:phosphoglycerol transferase MdoB-like AlkP superfamily enzyme